MLAKQLQGAALATQPVYVEEVFQSWLYTGNGSTQTITNGVDLSGKGGLVWTKSRSNATSSELRDTLRGATKSLRPDSTAAQVTDTGSALTSFNSDGFSLGADTYFTTTNVNGRTYASWTFRKQAKFFDVVTYTGNSVAGRTISHNLGSVPGCIIVKNITNAANWEVYHRSAAAAGFTAAQSKLNLNTTGAVTDDNQAWNGTAPTSTVFSVGDGLRTNQSGSNYVAYLFAHDAGGFGDDGLQNVVTCGGFTTNGSGIATVNLGYEPQFILFKRTDSADNWETIDTMRGFSINGNGTSSSVRRLNANASDAETSSSAFEMYLTSTGFATNQYFYNATYIYIAIRRGPMRPPTSGTSVFSPQTYTEIITNPTTLTTGWPTDLHLISRRTGTTTFYVADRLRGSILGNENFLETPSTVAETDYSTSPPLFTSNTGIVITNLFNNTGGQTDISYQFRRAPGFFDVVCYTGTGANRTVSHNLGAVPELMIVKTRVNARDWIVYTAATGNTDRLILNKTDAKVANSADWDNTSPTSSVFTVGGNYVVNDLNAGMVAYLFASVSGVSKVGSYTGNGSSQTINCGFTAGARFVMIKRTDSTGDWLVADTARGLVSGNDPLLRLNSTAAEVTTLDWIDPDNSGFIINQETTANANVNNATYIFLAIA